MTARELWDYCLKANRYERDGVSQDEYDEFRERIGQKWQRITLASNAELDHIRQERCPMTA